MGSTWVGGVVPGPGDEVIIAGPVHVTGTQSCASLLVEPAGQLHAASSGPATLSVAGAVTNDGLIENGSYFFTLELGGDLTNDGNWLNNLTRITGSADRSLSQDAAAVFASNLVFATGAAGDLIVETPWVKSGDLVVTGGRLLLGANCPLTVDAGRISGELRMNGNPLYVVSWTYLQNATLDAAVVFGEAEIAGTAHFTGGATIKDGLLPSSLTGGGHMTVAGGLINEGVITNTSYGLSINMAGDLVNNGEISCSSLQFDGASVHHLSMGPAGVFDVSMFLPEFQGGSIVADTPLLLRDGLGLSEGDLTLAPGADLTLLGWGSLAAAPSTRMATRSTCTA